MGDEVTQQQSDKLGRQESGATVGPSAPASTAIAQPPDLHLQGLSLTSPDRSHESSGLPEAVPVVLSARGQLRLENDGLEEEEDENSSRALTPASTSSHPLSTTSLPNLVAREQASPRTNTPQSDWESLEYPGISVVDEEHLVELINDVLESTFEDWLGHGTHQAAGGKTACGEPGSSGSGPDLPSKGASGKQTPKRKRAVGSGDEGNDDRRKSRGRGARSRGKHTFRQMLACHFCKRDPRRHRECCNFGGAKISYVKQHIYRKHSVDLYCARCMEQFDDVSTRDEHTRLATCQLVNVFLRPDGITSEQRQWLSRRMPPGTSEEQRWYTVWEYLFPGSPLPPSPCNNFDLSEDLFEFSDFITSPRGYDILLQNLRGNAAWTEEYETLFGPDLTSALGQFFPRWAATRDGRGGQTGVDRNQGVAAGRSSPISSENLHPTESDASPDIPAAGADGPGSENSGSGAASPQSLGAMDETFVQQANTTEVHADQTIEEGRAERLAPHNIVPHFHNGMGPMEPIPSLEAVFDRAQGPRAEDERLDLDEHGESERKENETTQPPLQLTGSGIEEAGPSGQTQDVATRGFEFLDFEYSSDVLAESSFLDWYNSDVESLVPEGWDGDFWIDE